MRWRVVGSSDHAALGNFVHRWRIGGGEWSFSVQFLAGFIGTAVWNNNDVFHGRTLLDDSKGGVVVNQCETTEQPMPLGLLNLNAGFAAGNLLGTDNSLISIKLL